MGLATFVFKMQLQSNEQLAISFKNLTANAEFKYLLSDENLSTSDTIVDKTNNSGVDLTSNLIIKNISNKKYLYMSFRCGLGQNSASVEDIQIEHNSSVTKYEDYVKDKIFILNANNVYEEFRKCLENTETEWVELNANIQYKVKNGIVFIYGNGNGNTEIGDGSYTNIGTLPVEFRPDKFFYFTWCTMGGEMNNQSARVGTDGNISLYLPTRKNNVKLGI